ncbi:MAG: hypothetical protein ACLRZ6_06660 [Lachnospiraceae bacterium]
MGYDKARFNDALRHQGAAAAATKICRKTKMRSDVILCGRQGFARRNHRWRYPSKDCAARGKTDESWACYMIHELVLTRKDIWFLTAKVVEAIHWFNHGQEVCSTDEWWNEYAVIDVCNNHHEI